MKRLGIYLKLEVEGKQEFHLQSVQLSRAHTTYSGVVCIVEKPVIEHFRSQHHTCYEKPVDVKGCEMNMSLLEKAIHINLRNDKAGGAAAEVLEDTVQILPDADVR